MKKSRQRLHSKSNASIMSKISNKSVGGFRGDVIVPPLDTVTVKILGLQLWDEDPRHYAVKVTFFDQLLLSGIIKPTFAREPLDYKTLATGVLNYDPSDYEKMCLFADSPLIVNIQPLKEFETGMCDGQSNTPLSTVSAHTRVAHADRNPSLRAALDISCCNVDILPIFIDLDSMCVKKRMQPIITPLTLQCKSWDNLPLLTLDLSATRHPDNTVHHEFMKNANCMKITLVGAYNMLIPFEDDINYMAATKMPLYNQTYSSLAIFNNGYKIPRRFDSTKFYPTWETLRISEETFNNGDEKLTYEIRELLNESGIDLDHYLNKVPKALTTIWGSFHRTLMLGDSEKWLSKQLRSFSWPFEVHISAEQGGYSFMAFLNLFKLLYPGERMVRLAVPLHWFNAQLMREKCNSDVLLSSTLPAHKASKATTQSAPASGSTDSGIQHPTGADDSPSFIIVEVKLARPLKQLARPLPPIPQPEIDEMSRTLEERGRYKRECTGRGQHIRQWKSTVRAATTALRSVPHVAMTDFCSLFRQLSETRTRVELLTSFWMDSAIFVNNNFVLQEFLKSDKMFEEMVMMAHTCLLKVALHTIIGVDDKHHVNDTLKAARHARQMQDVSHAMELYLLETSENRNDGNTWRELATCLQEVDMDWATISIHEALMLNIRHPLTLLIKACMVFEEDPDAAEPFFMGLLAWYPFWSTVWTVVHAYFVERELYRMADQIMDCLRLTREAQLINDMHIPRTWGHELGDWWEPTLLLPGMSHYYDAADLLLRIRAISLAEVCLAKALTDAGESAAYFHLVGLCCRLRGQIEDALCHVKRGIARFGDIGYLRSLEAECYHKMSDTKAAKESYEKVNNSTSGYSILLSLSCWDPQNTRPLLVDLVRQQPSAYSWTALAENWLQRVQVSLDGGGDADLSEEQITAVYCGIAYAVEGLKYDRRASRAWALLARLVRPSSRRLYCRNMATACGYDFPDDNKETSSRSRQSLCHRLGWVLPVCNCHMCDLLTM